MNSALYQMFKDLPLPFLETTFDVNEVNTASNVQSFSSAIPMRVESSSLIISKATT